MSRIEIGPELAGQIAGVQEKLIDLNRRETLRGITYGLMAITVLGCAIGQIRQEQRTNNFLSDWNRFVKPIVVDGVNPWENR